MIITKNTSYTVIPIWSPKYSTKYGEEQEWCLLPAVYKVQQATNIIVCEITKAKHILGYRYCMTRKQAMTYPQVSNNSIMCYEIPMSHFENFETPEEIWQVIDSFGWFDD